MLIKKFLIPAIVGLFLIIPQFPPVLSYQLNSPITVVPDDYSEGGVTIPNPEGMDLGRTYLLTVWVESRNGTVKGINVTVGPKIIDGWRKDERIRFNYIINCSELVPAGNYSLKLRFLATLPSGSLRVFTVSIPLEVLSSPIRVGRLKVLPEETVFLGDSLVVYVPVTNLGHKNVSINVSLSVLGVKETYSTSKSVILTPGDSSLIFEVPIDSRYAEGEYTVNLTIVYSTTAFSRTGKFRVLRGISIVSASLEKDELYPNEVGNLYLTIMSIRRANLSIAVDYYLKNRPLKNATISVEVEEGTQVVRIPLITHIPGRYALKYRVYLMGIGIGSGEVNYTVLSPPVIENVSVGRDENGIVFSVYTNNPDSRKSGVLFYNVTINGTISKSGSAIVEIPPGKGTIVLTIPQVTTGKVTYNLTLSVGEYRSSYSGIKVFAVSKGTTTSTVIPSHGKSRSPKSNSFSKSPPQGRAFWGLIFLAVGVSMVITAWIAWNRGFTLKNRRRSRPKPKRRSPLGRFKRPKPPRVRVFDSLPKKK